MTNPYTVVPTSSAEELPGAVGGARRPIRDWPLGLKGTFAIVLALLGRRRAFAWALAAEAGSA